MPDLSIQTFLPNAREYLNKARPRGVPGWSPDEAFSIQPLGQGEYNMNFLVKQGKTAWVLRVNTGSQIGLSDQAQIAYEYQTLALLAPLDVSPQPYFLDDSFQYLPFGVFGMSYLPGEKLDYQRDNEKAARLMARYHQLQIPQSSNPLILEQQTLSLTFQRCVPMLQVYLDSELGDPAVKSYLTQVRDWADQARLKERYFSADPWNCLINTEVNNTNWILNRDAGTIHLVDWEKPLWGDPSQDLSHYRVPTTTLWKTEYRMSSKDQQSMMNAYKESIADSHLRDTIEERTRLRDPFNCLRGVSWCAMAWVQYRRGDHLLKNEDTFRKLSMYVNPDFLRSLFDPFMGQG